MRSIQACGLLLPILYLTVASACADAESQGCTSQALTDQQKQAIADYVKRKYKLPGSIELVLQGEAPVRDTCYRELSFEGKTDLRTWQLKLYASPDLRFLSGDLLDTKLDPAEEERAMNEAVLKGLTQAASASRGPAGAPVTIVEFSDFQCPFCRKFAETLDQAVAGQTDAVRVVFHHFPLSGHNWARQAAEAAGCAQLQNSEAFWAFHDQLFQNQASITPENVKDKVTEFANRTKGLNLDAFHRCIQDGMAVGLVLKDLSLGQANHVAGTPTVFVNGRLAEGIADAKRLRELIEEARMEAATVAQKPPSRPQAGGSSSEP